MYFVESRYLVLHLYARQERAYLKEIQGVLSRQPAVQLVLFTPELSYILLYMTNSREPKAREKKSVQNQVRDNSILHLHLAEHHY